MAYIDQLALVEIPSQDQLLQSYPNPCNPETWHEAEVRLNIYSSEGVLVRRMNLGRKRTGNYQSRQQPSIGTEEIRTVNQSPAASISTRSKPATTAK